MDDVVLVDVGQAEYQACDDELWGFKGFVTGLPFGKKFSFADVMAEIASGEEIKA